jgi:hypothetical protein
MKIEFRIDWGYQFLYSRRHYHPFYRWDGQLKCDGGEIQEIYQLDYPVIWFGPGHCPHERKLERPEWQSTTRRGLSGIRVVAEADENAVFTLTTMSGTFEFTAKQILKDGRIVFHVGSKYSHCHVIVTRSRYLWFRPAPKPGQQAWEADDLSGVPVRDWARMRTAWLAPGESVEFNADFERNGEAVFHLVGMAAPAYTPGNEQPIHGNFKMELHCDGEPVSEFAHYFREHDVYMQMLEDAWTRFRVQKGAHRLTLTNKHEKYHLLLSRLTLEMSAVHHLQLSLPPWALAGEKLIGRIYAESPDTVEVKWPGGGETCELAPGWNDFRFTLYNSGTNVPITAGNSRDVIPAVYALADETPEVTVGYDMTTIPHDDNGFMDWLLDYTWRTRLGNLVVFRSFLKDGENNRIGADPALLARWGKFCREHHIYVEAATDYEDGALVKAAADRMHSAGRHEYPGAVYARDPAAPWASPDMKTAAENYLNYLKIEIDKAHQACRRAAFGDASGGHRYCYLAGADFLRTETMVPHTQHLCSQARPAAEALGDGEWGVHIAIHHAVQPYFENHLGIYFLSIFQPWMMGASMIYEEDSLFIMFKEERMAWDDLLTKGKRDMTREFYRFVKTHPRRGRAERRIAFLEGRYAAPFNGFICDSEQDPHYSVWGLFGNDDPAWGHGQPEKCRQLLDVLMPGACTHPLRQRYDRRRFFFSGTPYGDFDEVPVEAESGYFHRYALLLNLGWNTMIAEDHAKLKEYVKNGGTLFTGIPQFSTHVKRDFLRDWQDLSLWNGGDLSELCGVKVLGPGAEYSGQWNAADRKRFPEVELSACPSDSIAEDGPCRLAEIELNGAEVVAWDASTAQPLVVRFKLGKGVVYLLTAWAYPGHEQLQQTAASWIARLASDSRGDCHVKDPSREVFWNVWPETEHYSRMMLLNTDWTARANAKCVRVVTPAVEFDTEVKERTPLILTVLPFAVIKPSAEIHVEIADANAASAELKLHGTGQQTMQVYYCDGRTEKRELDFSRDTVLKMTLTKEQ